MTFLFLELNLETSHKQQQQQNHLCVLLKNALFYLSTSLLILPHKYNKLLLEPTIQFSQFHSEKKAEFVFKRNQ